MTTVKILIEGYAKELANSWKASSTTCLITTNGKKIISDPGCNREALLKALDDEGLSTKNIDYVFLSHRHLDHILLAGIFENAKHITFDASLVYDNDTMTEFDKHVLGEDIEIIETPGHVNEHLSLLVDTVDGKVAIVGDLIWWTDDEKHIFDINQKDHSKSIDMDMKLLIKSRKKIIARTDYIIPGHGKMFKVDKL